MQNYENPLFRNAVRQKFFPTSVVENRTRRRKADENKTTGLFSM